MEAHKPAGAFIAQAGKFSFVLSKSECGRYIKKLYAEQNVRL
jgi:hypothetical protein